MIDPGLPTERNFLINMAVRLFNEQYGRKIDPASCTLETIDSTYECNYGYEIRALHDSLRLRIYFTLGDIDFFAPYRLEVDTTYLPGGLGDEVYVMLGTVQRYYVDSGLYKFRKNYVADISVFDYIDDMNGIGLTFMTGESMQYVA